MRKADAPLSDHGSPAVYVCHKCDRVFYSTAAANRHKVDFPMRCVRAYKRRPPTNQRTLQAAADRLHVQRLVCQNPGILLREIMQQVPRWADNHVKWLRARGYIDARQMVFPGRSGKRPLGYFDVSLPERYGYGNEASSNGLRLASTRHQVLA